MHVLDPPGFQNPSSVGKQDGALFEDLCHNYEQERLQKFFHDTVFAAQMERYSQVMDPCLSQQNSISWSAVSQGFQSPPLRNRTGVF